MGWAEVWATRRAEMLAKQKQSWASPTRKHRRGWSEESKQKLSATKKRLGQRPGPSAYQRQLWETLGPGWKLEYPISMYRPVKKGQCGYWMCDIVHPRRRIVIEVDGPTHLKPKQQEKDRRRDLELKCNGWAVIRVIEGDVPEFRLS